MEQSVFNQMVVFYVTSSFPSLSSYVSDFQTSYLMSHFAVTASCFCFQAIMHHEGHMDDGLTLSRSQNEESRTARVIRSTVFLFNRFIRCAFKMIFSTLFFFSSILFKVAINTTGNNLSFRKKYINAS